MSTRSATRWCSQPRSSQLRLEALEERLAAELASGRAADLVDELGLEPGPELRRLEGMILAHDPELGAEDSAEVLGAPLPIPASATIGREGELAEIGALLTRPDVRLVTLIGAGGVGKTRLALEAGRTLAGRFPGGTAYVDLAGTEHGSALVTAAASALRVVAAT